MGDRMRRRTDLVEDTVAWMLLSAGMLGALLAALVGWSVDVQALARGRAEAAVRTQVSAVLIEDAPMPIGEAGGSRGPVYALARWTARDGSTRTGHVPADAGTPATASVRIWTDRGGSLVAAPIGAVGAAFLGVAAGVGAFVVVGTVLLLVWAVARRLIDARNAAYWEREWERVGSSWKPVGSDPDEEQR